MRLDWAVLGKEATVGGEPATLEDISTLPEFSEWLQNGGLDLSDFQFGGRAWVRTYNELVGDVRLDGLLLLYECSTIRRDGLRRPRRDAALLRCELLMMCSAECSGVERVARTRSDAKRAQ